MALLGCQGILYPLGALGIMALLGMMYPMGRQLASPCFVWQSAAMPPRIAAHVTTEEQTTNEPTKAVLSTKQRRGLEKARAVATLRRLGGTKAMNPTAGRAGPVTVELVQAVASLMVKGLSTKHALAQVAPKLTQAQFQHALQTKRVLSWSMDKAIGDGLLPLLEAIPGTTRSTLPVGTCWLLERVHNYVPSSKSSVQVSHEHSIAGFDAVVVARAAQLSRLRHAPAEVRSVLAQGGADPGTLKGRTRAKAIAENMPSPTLQAGGHHRDGMEIQKSAHQIDGMDLQKSGHSEEKPEGSPENAGNSQKSHEAEQPIIEVEEV